MIGDTFDRFQKAAAPYGIYCEATVEVAPLHVPLVGTLRVGVRPGYERWKVAFVGDGWSSPPDGLWHGREVHSDVYGTRWRCEMYATDVRYVDRLLRVATRLVCRDGHLGRLRPEHSVGVSVWSVIARTDRWAGYDLRSA